MVNNKFQIHLDNSTMPADKSKYKYALNLITNVSTMVGLTMNHYSLRFGLRCYFWHTDSLMNFEPNLYKIQATKPVYLDKFKTTFQLMKFGKLSSPTGLSLINVILSKSWDEEMGGAEYDDGW